MRAALGAMLLVVTAQAAPDHSLWDSLLREYVTATSLVDYGRLQKTGTADLDRYLAGVAQPWPRDWSPADRKAALINAYNALTVRWILRHYPVQSIWRTKDPFKGTRHQVDGRTVSLDAIETELRGMGDPRIHAALVCAARSCPPLRREAYRSAVIDAQLDDNTRAWLADEALNRFDAVKGVARVSSIFKWYGGDFPSVAEFLTRYAPSGKGEFPRGRAPRIEYLGYRWGLNDTTDLGKSYSQAQFLWDRARSVF